MKVIVIGATGTIGSAVVAALRPRHEVVSIGHTRGSRHVDLANPASIAEMYRAVGPVDAVICAAGRAKFAPFASLTDEDYAMSLSNKLMGQVNVVRLGLPFIAGGGSITLTAGFLARFPAPGSPLASLVNAGLEGFARAVALEAPRGIRVNAVSPPWVAETLVTLGRDPRQGKSAAVVAQAYVRSLEGPDTGVVIDP